MKTYKKSSVLKRVKSFIRYIFDKEIPKHKKVLIFLGFLYLIFPLDIIPDTIVGIGMIDDLTILFLIFNYYQKELEKYDKSKLKNSIKDKNIIKDVQYKVKTKKDEERGEQDGE